MRWFTKLLHRGVKDVSSQPQVIKGVQQGQPKKRVKVDLVNSEHLFYDLLFGDTTEISVKNEQIERAIIDRVSEVLINPKK